MLTNTLLIETMNKPVLGTLKNCRRYARVCKNASTSLNICHKMNRKSSISGSVWQESPYVTCSRFRIRWRMDQCADDYRR